MVNARPTGHPGGVNGEFLTSYLLLLTSLSYFSVPFFNAEFLYHPFLSLNEVICAT
jgi:hypothetical protein